VGRGNHRTLLIDHDIVMDTLYFEVGPEKVPSGSLASWSSAHWGSIAFPDLRIKSTEIQ
jgi:hypothetical protein